jgi:hypothetical protein
LIQCDFGPVLRAHRFDFGGHHFDSLEFLTFSVTGVYKPGLPSRHDQAQSGTTIVEVQTPRSKVQGFGTSGFRRKLLVHKVSVKSKMRALQNGGIDRSAEHRSARDGGEAGWRSNAPRSAFHGAVHTRPFWRVSFAPKNLR